MLANPVGVEVADVGLAETDQIDRERVQFYLGRCWPVVLQPVHDERRALSPNCLSVAVECHVRIQCPLGGFAVDSPSVTTRMNRKPAGGILTGMTLPVRGNGAADKPSRAFHELESLTFSDVRTLDFRFGVQTGAEGDYYGGPPPETPLR